MAIYTFKGGVHPFEGKELSKNKKIADYTPTGDLVIPVSQHIGAPAKPVVEVGDIVLSNQLIAEADGFVSANVHSPVSGTVKAIENRLLANGNEALCIIIENDKKYTEISIDDHRTLDELSEDDIISLIKNAGVVGMGGAGFPAHVKLSPKNPEKIRFVIVNAAECEPYLTSDYRRMMEEPEIIIEGLKIVLKLFPKAKGIIAIEDNKLDALVKIKKLLNGTPNIEVREMLTKYPQGGERVLIYALTGRKVNSSMLPADVGCIVHNVDTIHAIHDAVINKKPLTKRIVTVTGDLIKKPKNFNVPIGASYEELITAAGGLKKEPDKIISGGPMMGIALITAEVPITKGSSAILCLSKDETDVTTTNCISCGRCVKVCPGRVVPSLVAKAAENGDKEGFVRLKGMECCECGCCSYVCPAKKNLTQSIKTMRKEILADRKKKG